MGKKSASKVDATPVAVVPQSGKKGKRGSENLIEKASAKKQKVERDEAVLANQKTEKKQVKKADSSSSSEEDSDVSDSDSEPKVAAKKMTIPVKNGSAVAKKPKEDTSSDSSDSESDSDVSDEKPAVKNGSIAAKKTTAPADSSDSSESESDDDDDKKPAVAVKKCASTEADSSEESESDDESSEDEKETKAAAQPKKSEKKPAESSESSDSDESSSDKEDVTKAPPAAAAAKGKVESSDDDSSEDSDSDEEPKANKPKAVASKESESSDGSSDDGSDEEKDQKTPKKKDPDVEMVDAEKSVSTFQKTPKTPASTGSKTLFTGNLSFDVEESDVHEFFKDTGKIVDVRFATDHDGQFKGFGHVEFETADAAQKAMELNGQLLRDRPVRLDLARERGAATPNRDSNSFQRGGKPEGQSAFITGFDTELGEDAIRSELQQVFGSCGAITRISIPPDHETGTPKGVAFIDFSDSDGLSAALGLNDTEAAGGCLHVKAAKPRGDSAGRGGGRFDRGGGRSGGRFGGRGGRDGGGRFGGRGGRDGGRGGRFSGGRGGRDGGRGGRGTPYKNSVPSGKKTVFGDD